VRSLPLVAIAIWISPSLAHSLQLRLLDGVNAGVRRFDRRKLMLVSDVARMFTVLLFIFVRSSDSLWLLYVASILQFSVRAWHSFISLSRDHNNPALIRSFIRLHGE